MSTRSHSAENNSRRDGSPSHPPPPFRASTYHPYHPPTFQGGGSRGHAGAGPSTTAPSCPRTPPAVPPSTASAGEERAAGVPTDVAPDRAGPRREGRAVSGSGMASESNLNMASARPPILGGAGVMTEEGLLGTPQAPIHMVTAEGGMKVQAWQTSGLE